MKSSTMPLLRHGQRVRPEYEAPPGEIEGAMGASTDEQRPGGQVSGVVKRFKKDEAAAYDPQALGWIKAVYTDAIEYTGMTKELHGMAFWWGVFFTLVAAFSIGSTLHINLGNDFDVLSPLWVGWFVLLSFMGPFGIYMLTFGIRMTVGQPQDLPIIFDRKYRKVYRILREQPPGLKGMFMPWPLRACEYEWDLVDAEHNAEVFTTGGTLMRNHYLMFAVRKSAQDPTIIDSFQVANASDLSEELVPCMWEHIRRFMEEGGPHLPRRGEPLASQEAPPSWWDSCGAVGFVGSRYSEHWREQPGITFFGHLIFPLSVPMNLIWGTGNWLFYKTAVRVQWPDEVTRAIGQARAISQ